MKTATVAVVVAAALVSSALAQSFTLNTPPTPVQCVPTQFTWSGGVPPYTLFIQEPDATGTIVQQYGPLTGTSFTWPTNITQGQVGATLRDNTGASAQTAPFVIGPGASDSCISGDAAPPPTSGSSGSSDTTPATSGPSSASTPAVGTVGTSASSSSSGSSSGSASASHSSTSSAPAASNTGGALANTAAVGVVGVVGAVLAAILA